MDVKCLRSDFMRSGTHVRTDGLSVNIGFGFEENKQSLRLIR